ncbi:hypothetical protein ACFY05_32220 [Microtetraspora fusca]|uniref:Uncharacterized protein n=1 Tax=Microtetraspora fusca TaxID=1997 RepID=A0ABW6VH16_MICFU
MTTTQNPTPYEMLTTSAALVQAIAATERAIATGQPRTPASDKRVEDAGRELLDKLAKETDPGARMELCEELHDVLEPIVGEWAATVLLTISCMYEDMAADD